MTPPDDLPELLKKAVTALKNHLATIYTAISRNNSHIADTPDNRDTIHKLRQAGLGHHIATHDAFRLHSTIVRLIRHHTARGQFQTSGGIVAVLLNDIRESSALYRHALLRFLIYSTLRTRQKSPQLSSSSIYAAWRASIYAAWRASIYAAWRASIDAAWRGQY